MSFLNTARALRQATEQGYCLGAYNADNLDYMRAIVQAAEEEQALVIMAGGEQALQRMGLKYFAKVARQLAEETPVPVGIHLDHGGSLETIKACLDEGFTSVMIDASHRPLRENILLTREVVKLAERYGAFTEGEIGHVPGFEEKPEGERNDLAYTDPAEAAEYCRESGVHSLAISIGTVHYMRKEPLKLDFHLLDRIKKAVPVSLVLHGGAAVTDEDMGKAVVHGIVKYNIAYKPYRAFLYGMEEELKNLKEEISPGKLFVFPSQIMKAGVEAAKKIIRLQIRLLGASGKANRGLRAD
ncbi:MAG: class II fructose-bisphosphate aldolase [Deltaproteobacteria bacterium]|nr:MAG: class II fructose-bisphosphate aldolase [Deltaproteobacteria bacterium]